MRVLYHPEFANEIRKFEARYAEVSSQPGERFCEEVDHSVEVIKSSPTSAGSLSESGFWNHPPNASAQPQKLSVLRTLFSCRRSLDVRRRRSQPLRSINMADTLLIVTFLRATRAFEF